MSDPRQDLRATAASVHGDAALIKKLEEEKAELDPADPRVDELSDRVERLSRSLRDKAVAEDELSEEIQRER